VQTQVPPVAIVGVSAFFPGSTDATGFWRDILAGRDLITDVPPSHWLIEDYYDPDPNAPDKTYSKRGAFLERVDFDPMEFGIPPSIVPATDTVQLLALIVAQKVLDDATQGQFSTMDRDRASVILGVTSGQELLGQMVSRLQKPVWLKALRESGIPEDEAQRICARIAASYVPWQESSFPGLLGNVVAGRIANRFDLRGTNTVTDAACASSLSAISMAVNELVLGQSDLVISGGVDTMNDILMYMCFSKTPALSRSGDCRPFADDADGTMLGEGMAMVALKRLADAERDGDRIYAVIRGVGSSSDGRSKSVYAPLPEGQARALRRAYDAAGYGPGTVELVEAHGTGTMAGDAAEFEGLRTVFDAARPGRSQWCAVGSVKSQIGHTKAAAGAAGLFKAIMALHHKVLPPTIKVERPNPKLEIDESAFYLNTETRPWIRDVTEHPRRASVSSFGFGGSNFHITLEEYLGPSKAWQLRASPSELVLLSAQSAPELISQCVALAKDASEKGLEAVARESQERFSAPASARLAIVATTASDLAVKLEQAATRLRDGQPFSAPGLHFATGRVGGTLALLFPGQGSQYVGMGAALAMAFEPARSVWDAVAGFDLGGRSLHDVVFPRPVFTPGAREAQQKELTATEWAQPAIGAMSLALLSVLTTVGIEPDCVAGHSFGELTALAAARAFDPIVLVQIARRRGELMRDAAASVPGAMVAVSRPLAEVQQFLAQWPNVDVVVANHNHPTQVVLSGSLEAIAALVAKLTAEGVEAKRLPVATAFHSPLVAPSSAPFRTFLQGVAVRAPQIDVYGNAEAAPYPQSPDAVRERLAAQIARPVRFVEEIEAMWERGVRTFVEVGPGSVLTDLVGRILGTRPYVAVALDRKGKDGITMLHEGLGRLAVAGIPMDLAPLWASFAPRSQGGKKKPLLTIPLCGINHGKPYPPSGGAKDLPAPNPARPVQTPAVPVVAPTPQTAAVVERATNGDEHANEDYEKAMAASHDAFVRAVEESLAGLAAKVAGMKVPAIPPTPALAPVVAPDRVEPALPVAALASTASPAVIGTSVPSSLQTLLLGVVADKTGYPVEMLGLHMELEADLGIDSIKRVEILSAIREREPGMPVVDGAAMAQLRTLGQIIEYLQGAPKILAPAPESTPLRGVDSKDAEQLRAPALVEGEPVSAPTPVSASLQGLLLDVVSEKTGYPTEMLGLHMELEADLGIDSIKRVEILSAIREREPGLPAVDGAAMAQLRTLGQIIEYLQGAPKVLASAPESTPLRGVLSKDAELVRAPALAGGDPGPAPVSPNLQGLLLDVVSEKTGYPAEMLGLHMELEADLGIDSIKRVEILSAIREREPGLPAVDGAAMAQLRTLGQIVEYMRGRHASEPVVTAPTVASATPVLGPAPASTDAAVAAPTAGALEALLLAVVSDKTGYPAEMIGLHMELEADLGIDSIKRVEILSAIREREPGLPVVEGAALAQLRTLGQIVEFMSRGGAPATVPDLVAESAVFDDNDPIDRFVVTAVPAAPIGLAVSGLLSSRRAVVTDDGGGVARAVVEKLALQGVGAEVVNVVPADADAVLFLGGLREVGGIEAALAVNRDAFLAARSVAARMTERGGLFVTVQDTGGDFGLSGNSETGAWLSGLAGLARTAAVEWPAAAVRALDVERGRRPAEAIAESIVEELLTGGAAREIGLCADGRRTTLRVVRRARVRAVSPMSEASVIVASGGGRGVTAAALVELARRHRPKIVLLGRTPLVDEPAAARGITDDALLKRALLDAALRDGEKPTPLDLAGRAAAVVANREIRATVDAIRATGGQAKYVACDVQDIAQVRAALDTVRREWGAITGIVHGAGVLADKLIAAKTPEQFQRVFDTKVRGLRALLEATAGDPVSMIALFSSITARTGNQGQADYSMANEILNKVAAVERRRRRITVKSIGWGPWDGGMVNPALRARFEEKGVSLVAIADGARTFVNEVCSSPDEVEMLAGAMPPTPAPWAVVLEVRVDARHQPYIGDHRIAGRAVLPVVMAVEWMARAANACRPERSVVSMKDVKVLRGIKLTDYDGAGQVLYVYAKPGSNGSSNVVAVEIRSGGRDGTVHYTASAEMDVPRAAASAARAATHLAAWGDDVVYDGRVLFHGPGFQAIRSVDGIAADGIAGTLSRAKELGWGGRFETDPLMLDGGLQLAVLWSQRVLSGASLPMKVGAVHLYKQGRPNGHIQATVHGNQVHKSRAVCDVTFAEADGSVVAELKGVETILRPDDVVA
jgi:acyl transferase domain-containing protein/acyl carrier protein/NADP-dependent 3-hydroxy acid dehydrogenase YdfG